MSDFPLMDAVAAHALACYYREARIPASRRRKSDAAALLENHYEPDSLTDAAEAKGHNMGDTRAACMAWGALAYDFIGFNAVEAAQVYVDIADMVKGNAAALAQLSEYAATERNTWRELAAIPTATDGDREALQAWEHAVSVADKAAAPAPLSAADTARVSLYSSHAMHYAQGVMRERANGHVHSAAVLENSVITLADATIATLAAGSR